MTESEFDLSREITNNLYDEFSWLFQNNSQYVKMVNIVDRAIDNYDQQIRVDERKEVLDKVESELYYEMVIYDKKLQYSDIVKILKQIKKGENQ